MFSTSLLKLLVLIFFSSYGSNILAYTSDELHAAFEQGIACADHYEIAQGRFLRYTSFKVPNEEKSKGTVFFLQGRGTFLEFYEALVTPLLQRDLNVWMYDLSGQGGSSRLTSEKIKEENSQYLQHVESFDTYLDDAELFIQNVLLPQTKGPFYLLGYSTGSHLALRYLQKAKNNPFQAAFLISPLLVMKSPICAPCLPYLFWGASFFLNFENYLFNANAEDPIFKMPFENNPYTSDEKSYKQLKNLCIEYKHYVMGGVSYGWVKAALDSLKCLWKDQAIELIHIPVLIATGGQDGVVEVSYNELFTNKLKYSKHIFYPTARHEIFRENLEIQHSLWNNFDEFIQQNLNLIKLLKQNKV